MATEGWLGGSGVGYISSIWVMADRGSALIGSKAGRCRSWLAGDAGNSVLQAHPDDAIAGKPAPTR